MTDHPTLIEVRAEINKIVSEQKHNYFSEGEVVNCMMQLLTFILSKYRLVKR